MWITLLGEASPGELVAVSIDGKQLDARWRGTAPAGSGEKHAVEVEFGDITSCKVDPGAHDPETGLRQEGTDIVVNGWVSMVYEDGMTVIDFGPGTVLVDQEELGRTPSAGDTVELTVKEIELHPENL